PKILDEVLAQRFHAIEEVEEAVSQDLGLDWRRIATNVYVFVDRDNVFYGNTADGKVHAYGLVDSSRPESGIKVLRTLDFTDTLQKVAAGASASLRKYGAMIVGCNLTYDGKLIVLTNRSVTVMDRSFQSEHHTLEFGSDEYVSNSMAVDEKNGIYIASDTT